MVQPGRPLEQERAPQIIRERRISWAVSLKNRIFREKSEKNELILLFSRQMTRSLVVIILKIDLCSQTQKKMNNFEIMILKHNFKDMY